MSGFGQGEKTQVGDEPREQRGFVKELIAVNFSGVQNFPTVGLSDGVFRQNREATGMGYDKEVVAVRIAHVWAEYFALGAKPDALS